jgi:hypothetical protein
MSLLPDNVVFVAAESLSDGFAGAAMATSRYLSFQELLLVPGERYGGSRCAFRVSFRVAPSQPS